MCIARGHLIVVGKQYSFLAETPKPKQHWLKKPKYWPKPKFWPNHLFWPKGTILAETLCFGHKTLCFGQNKCFGPRHESRSEPPKRCFFGRNKYFGRNSQNRAEIAKIPRRKKSETPITNTISAETEPKLFWFAH